MAVLRPCHFALEPLFAPTPPVISGRIASDDSIPSLSLDGLMMNPFDKGFIPLLPYAADDGPNFTLVATPSSLLRAAAVVPKVETNHVPAVASAAVPALPSVPAVAASIKVESPSDDDDAPTVRTPRRLFLTVRPPHHPLPDRPLRPPPRRHQNRPRNRPAPPVRFANGVLFLRKPRYERVVRAVRHQHQGIRDEVGIPSGPKGREEVRVVWIEMPGGERMELTRERWVRLGEAALMRPGAGQGKVKIVFVSRVL
ncbi:hypothetical protein LTR94_009905 [Friedmanniomyces endolithicus]|nr:hypothetical protein LTR94_009905 [Friedmanniomyces endolithicus]KAK0803073.1 hypothetical protein LTR38_006259 [Friedmanniomyces endolithicus]